VVRLALYLEVSSIAPSSLVAGQLITNKRSFDSVVLVEDGNYVVLSGLIEDKTNVSQQKVPLLGDIPFLGAFFRYETRERNRTNTMVFLRPIIVRDESTSAAIATERYEYMRTQMADARVPDSLIFRDINVAPIRRRLPRRAMFAPAPASEAAPAAEPAPAPAPAPSTPPALAPAAVAGRRAGRRDGAGERRAGAADHGYAGHRRRTPFPAGAAQRRLRRLPRAGAPPRPARSTASALPSTSPSARWPTRWPS